MKRQPQSAIADETTDRSEHLESVPLGRSRHQTHELRTVVVDPTVDPRKAFTLRKLSKPGEAPEPWRTARAAGGATSRTVGGATMQVATVGSKEAAQDLQETGGVAESIAARKLKARRTVKIDETAPMPDVAPREPPSVDEEPAGSSAGIDVPPPSGVAVDSRLLAELTPPGLKPVKAASRRRSRPATPTPLGLGPVVDKRAPRDSEAQQELDQPYDLEDEKITRPIRSAAQAFEDAVTHRLPTVPARAEPARAEPAAAQGFPWPVAAATGLAVLALVAYLMFGGRADPAARDGETAGSNSLAAESETQATAVRPRAATDPKPLSKDVREQRDSSTPVDENDSTEEAGRPPAEKTKPDVRPKSAPNPGPSKATPSSTGRLF